MSSNLNATRGFSTGALIRVGRHLHLRGTSIMVFLIYWLMVLTYPNFFIVNPSAETGALRQLALWICLLGWIVQSTITPVLLWKLSDGFTFPMRWIPLTTLLWPFGVVLAQLTAFVQSDTDFLGYLVNYPVFIITDIALPAFILWKWHEIRTWIKFKENPIPN